MDNAAKPVGADFMEKKMEFPAPPFMGNADIKDTIIQNLMNDVKSKDARIKELTDMLLEQAGFVGRKVEIPNTADMQPVTSHSHAWPGIRKRLEAKYAKKEEDTDKFASAAENVALELEEL